MSDPSANQPPGHTDHPSRHSDFNAAGAEERVGKLVAEIGVVIRSADPDRRLETQRTDRDAASRRSVYDCRRVAASRIGAAPIRL